MRRIRASCGDALKRPASIGGRPGPAVLLVPGEQLQAGVPPRYVEPWAPPARPATNPEALRHAARFIAGTCRPTIISGGGADIQTWMCGKIRIRKERDFLDHNPMGATGPGTGPVVGAAAAHLEFEGENAAVTVLITGDGAIDFHPAEIHADVRANLKLIMIIGNDGAWGTELRGQHEAIGKRVNTELGALPDQKLGEAFGVSSQTVVSPQQLEAQLNRTFANTDVTDVNVEIDRGAGKEFKTNPEVRMILFSDILA